LLIRNFWLSENLLDGKFLFKKAKFLSKKATSGAVKPYFAEI